MGESMKREDADAVLSAELKRLSRADADAINNVTILQFRARKDLSIGAFPDLAKQRFTEITTFRVRPGHDAQFEAAARAYGGAAKRSAPATSFRVYQMMAGGPESTYMVFASVQSYAEFDKMMQEGEGVMKGATAAEREALEKFSNEGVIGVETQRFRVDPVMSYVPKDTRASDPAFWSPKKPAPATQTTSAQKPAVQQTAAKK
jgi:hypothetical protein